MGAKLIYGALFLFVFCVPSGASEMAIRVTTTASHDVFVKGYVWANSKCEALQPPPILIDRPPKHGVLCSTNGPLRLDPKVTRQGAPCAGRIANGIHIIYLPRAGYVGSDDTHYVVKFPAEDHDVEVSVTVTPPKPNSPAAVPRDLSAPEGDRAQSPGYLPSCAALVS